MHYLLIIICKVHFILEFDKHTFFIKCGIGEGVHTKHPAKDKTERSTRARFVDKGMMVYQKELAVANIQPGQTAAAVNRKFDVSLTRRQVAYHQGLAKLATDMADADELEKADALGLSQIDHFIEMLKKRGASYCSIYHRKDPSASELPKPKKSKNNVITAPTNPTVATSDDVLWTETASPGNAEPECAIVGEPDALGEDMIKYARESRVAVNATDDQDVLIALVWVLPHGKRLFRAFPEVNFIDGTHKTNNENRPLITGGVRDADGKVSVVFRALVPNERAWLFRWLFHVALPSLLGSSYCELVCIQITDGDSQETSQLDHALKTVFRNSKRRRCGWHIVEKGWQRHMKGSLVKSDAALHVASVVKNWLYSLMKDIETATEYEMYVNVDLVSGDCVQVQTNFTSLLCI